MKFPSKRLTQLKTNSLASKSREAKEVTSQLDFLESRIYKFDLLKVFKEHFVLQRLLSLYTAVILAILFLFPK